MAAENHGGFEAVAKEVFMNPHAIAARKIAPNDQFAVDVTPAI